MKSFEHMNIKFVNYGLLFLVAILLFLSILVFANIIFASSEGVEWGDVSSWVSSIATLGTFFVAIFAYKKADNYLENKVREKGFDIFVTLISESFVSYFHLLNDTCTNASHLKRTMLLFGMTEEKIDCRDLLQDLDHRIESLFAKSSYIEKDLLKLSLMKVSLSNKIEYNALSNFCQLEKIRDAYVKINNEIYTNDNQLDINNNLLHENIDFIIDTTISISNNLKKHFFTSKHNYMALFDI